MELQNLNTADVFDINFECYLYLKELNGTNGVTARELRLLLEQSFRYTSKNYKVAVNQYEAIFQNVTKDERHDNLFMLSARINSLEKYYLFNFCLKLLTIKPLLLAEAKLIESQKAQTLSQYHQLSLDYDTISKHGAYYVRVNSSLLALLMFQKLDNQEVSFLASATDEFVSSIQKEYEYLKGIGLNANQMFMLMFSESVNQSITTSGGSSYEDRIMQILIHIGIEHGEISKVHDSADNSTEFDMFFNLQGKTYGIGAKRTLRERYKQFIKTAQMTKIDVMIEITLGIDLTETKAQFDKGTWCLLICR